MEGINLKFSGFFKMKDGMVEPTCKQFHWWRESGRPIKYVRCDNGGKNLKLEKRADSSDWKLNLKFEYTVQDTPQQNHLAELAFSTLYNKGRAMMIDTKIPKKLHYKLLKEAFATVTLLDGLMAINYSGKVQSHYEHWAGKNPDFSKHLRT